VADVGQYRCVAINDHDNITSQPATVTVNRKCVCVCTVIITVTFVCVMHA